MRCRPSIRISETTKLSKAMASADRQASRSRAAIRFIVTSRKRGFGAAGACRVLVFVELVFNWRWAGSAAARQVEHVVVQGQAHQRHDQEQPHELCGDLNAVADRPALNQFN